MPSIPWGTLPAEQQLELGDQYGRYLDSLHPICSLETKIERFQHWLNQRGVLYK